LGDLDFPELTPEAFPLPTLGQFFAGLGRELLDGRGFLLLRGLPRERYSLDDIGLIYYGLGVHLGRPVAQSYQGELLGNVIDVSDVEAQARGYHAGGGQRMHSDLLAALYGEWVFRRMELDAQYGTGPLTKRVVIFSRDSGQLTCNVSGSYPYRAVKAGDWVMTPTQIAALDEMARIAASPDLYLDMSIGEGDIQFLNNRAILHGRTDYEDSPEIATRRHMLRLWLQMPSWPELPANQGMQSPADYPLWQRQRTSFMEVPTRYLAEMTRRKAELAA
jgi:hypothetical protein